MNTKRYLGLFVFLLIGSLSAQNATISLRTLQLGGAEMPESWVRVKNEEEPVMLSWLTTQPTQPIEVIHDGSESLKLFRQTTNADGKKVAEVANTIRIPDSTREVLLLAWASDDDAKYVAIKDEFINAKFNDWMGINTSDSPVAVLAGDDGRPVRVEPGKSLIFRPAINEGKGVRIVAQAQRRGELKTFLSSYWPAFPGQRTIIIFYEDGEKMRAKRIGDRFVKKQEEP